MWLMTQVPSLTCTTLTAVDLWRRQGLLGAAPHSPAPAQSPQPAHSCLLYWPWAAEVEGPEEAQGCLGGAPAPPAVPSTSLQLQLACSLSPQQPGISSDHAPTTYGAPARPERSGRLWCRKCRCHCRRFHSGIQASLSTALRLTIFPCLGHCVHSGSDSARCAHFLVPALSLDCLTWHRPPLSLA